MRLDFSQCLFIDFEAQSELDIGEVGAYVYAEHPSTRPLCAAWCYGDSPVMLWREGQRIPRPWEVPGGWWVAWNHDTEQQILAKKFGLNISNWIDPASLASAAGLPRKLGEVALALHLEHGKGDKSAMLQAARPRKPTKDNPDRFCRPNTHPELFEKLYAYCIQDVVVMREICLKHLPPHSALMPEREQKLEALTNEMNLRGVQVDLANLREAKREVVLHTDKLAQEFTDITGLSPGQKVRIAKHFELPGVGKEIIRHQLKTCPPGTRRRALELLKTLNTAATHKLNAFTDRTTQDGRLHGAMVYQGAGRTGRWSSMGVQLQNLIRGLSSSTPDWPAIDPSSRASELAFEALSSGNLSLLYDNPVRVVASMMRGFLLGPFLAGDFSQIEPRTLAKLSKQASLLKAFAEKQDPYKALASRVYGVPQDKITKDQRFMGKQGVLGCGYNLGWRGFQAMLKTIYDVDVDQDEADAVVKAYRAMNPQVVQFWYDLDFLIKSAVIEQWQEFRSSARVGKDISARVYKSWLLIKLPSGRILWYFEPSLVPGERGMELHYWGRNAQYGGKWMRVKTYGGKLTENVTQAIARDIMAEAMLRLDQANFKTVLTVHDEIVCEPRPDLDDKENLAQFEHLMLAAPSWWPGIPLDVEAQLTRRYEK